MSKYLLPVKQINNNMTNCFIPICTENAFSTVLEYMNIPYKYAFVYATNFSFCREFCDSGRVADGIFTSYNFIKHFEDIYKAEIFQRNFTFFHSYIKYIEAELKNNRPVIAHFDSYYIPWSTLYNVRHTSHLIVVIGMDTSAKSLTILDPIDREEPVTITYSQFKSGSHFCLEIHAPEANKEIPHEEFVSDVLSSHDKLVSSNMFQHLHNMALCTTEIFDPYIEFRDCHNNALMVEEKLVDDIRKFMQSINMFTVWLKWFSEETNSPHLDVVIEEFKSILSKWNIFINMLYKRSLTKWESDFKYKLSQFIDNIATMHEEAYVHLIECLQNRSADIEKCSISYTHNSSYSIELVDYFNNKGFVLSGNYVDNCDLTNAGEYFSIDSSHVDSSMCDNMFKIEDIDFKIEHNSKCDNIICNNQLIKLDKHPTAIGIGIICCSEWGRANDMITVNFTDNTSSRFAVYANDLPEYNTDTSCITGQTFDINGNIIQEKAALTINVFYFTENQISSIQLPKCPNMHVLAISILK